MSTGLLLFLVFMALSIIDSVARARRAQQQKQVPPPEDEDGEEWRAQPSSAQAEAGRAEKRDPGEAVGELLGLEKLMGPGYLEKLMGPGVAGAIQDDEEVPRAPEPEPAASKPDGRRVSSLGRDERRVIARDRRTSDQGRRRAEAGRRARVEQAPEAEGWRSRVEEEFPEGDRRLSKRHEAGDRPARARREASPLKDSSVGERRRTEPAAAAPSRAGRGERHASGRTRVYRELFGSGDRDSLRRAFVLKEILDAPASERPPERRDTG